MGFRQADLMNDVFHKKIFEIGIKFGGEAHFAPVKTEKRALQKVMRSYGENWRKLGDLVRSSLMFQSLEDPTRCMLELGADPEIIVLKCPDAKMRLRNDY